VLIFVPFQKKAFHSVVLACWATADEIAMGSATNGSSQSVVIRFAFMGWVRLGMGDPDPCSPVHFAAFGNDLGVRCPHLMNELDKRLTNL